MKRYLTICLSTIFAIAPIAANAATVTPVSGQVLIQKVNTNGYVSISGPTQAAAGDTVMVYPGGSAQISYGSGCNVPVQPGAVTQVSGGSPCSPGEEAGQTDGGTQATADGGVNFTTIAVGVGVVGAGVGLALAAGGGSDDKKKKPASP